MKQRRIHRALPILGLLLLVASPIVSSAASGPVTSVSYTGTLASPQDYFSVTFTLTAATTVTIKTWGFGGGTNSSGQAIPSGGFDPLITLFSGLAATATIYSDTSGNPIADADLLQDPTWSYSGNCPPAGTVAIGANSDCGDVKLQIPLAAGTYTLLLTYADYLPGAIFAGGVLAQPFVDLTGGTAQFQTCDVADNTCVSRSGNYAVDIVGAGQVIKPYSRCDLNQDGNTNAGDVQLAMNQALGTAAAVNDLNQDGTVGVVDVAIVIDAALSGVCFAK
jgi:hypothetical protein